MTQSADPSEVLTRDARRCVNCESTISDDTQPSEAVWDLGERGIDDAMVAVCADCAALLRGTRPDWRQRCEQEPAAGLLDFLRAVTSTQGGAVADVAALSTETTGGLDGTDAQRQYLEGRRRSTLQLAVVDRHLVAAGIEATALGPATSATTRPDDPGRTHVLSDSAGVNAAIVDTFETVLAEAIELQTHLRAVLDLLETAVAVEGSCHICLESVVGVDTCPACTTPVRDGVVWRDETGSLDAVGLYGTITDRLESASATTTRLTDHAGSLAERLAD